MHPEAELLTVDAAGELVVDTAMYLVLTRDGRWYPSTDPQSTPDLLLAVGPACLGTDGYDLPEDLAAALAGRIGVDLRRPGTWPSGGRLHRLPAAHPDLHLFFGV